MNVLASIKSFLPLIRRTAPRRVVRRSERISPFAILAMLAFAVICGMTVPILGYLVPAIIGVMVLSFAVLILSPPAITWLLLVLVLLVVGQLTFFLNFRPAYWVPYLMLLLVAVKSLMEQIGMKARAGNRLGFSHVSAMLGVFFFLFILSAVANKTDLASVGVAAKNYIAPWFLTVLVATTIQRTDDLRSVWKFMLWVVIVQLPFATLQHFYYAKLRNDVGDSGWDAVVGSFGGNAMSGGASGTMAIFLVFGVVLAASLFRRKQIGLSMLIGVVLAALTTVALAEVKIFFVTVPLGLILLFRMSIFTNPLRTLWIGLLGAILLGFVLLIYQQTYSEENSKTKTLEGLVEYVFATESDPYYFNRETKELSRLGAVLTWERYNDVDDHRFYLGYGPAASRESQTLGIGIAAQKYPFTLTTSAASSMLWDTGLCSYVLLLGILLVAGLSAYRLARRVPPMEAAALDSIGIMLLLNLPLSLYNRDLIDSATTQVLIAFWVGYILLCRKLYSENITKDLEYSRLAA